MESRRSTNEEASCPSRKTYAVHFYSGALAGSLDFRFVCRKLGDGSRLVEHFRSSQRSGFQYRRSAAMPDIFWRSSVRFLASGHQRILYPLPVSQPIGQVLSGRDGEEAE